MKGVSDTLRNLSGPMNEQPKDPKARGQNIRIIAFLLISGFIFSVGIAELIKSGEPTENDGQIGEVVPVPVTPRGELYPSEKSMVALFRKASPSVVHIVNKVPQASRVHFHATRVRAGEGSGFVWDKKGHIVTNYHVIEQSLRTRERLVEVALGKGGWHNARVIGWDVDKDLAVIRIQNPPSLRPIPVGTSKDLDVGQTVLAIGNPFGMDQTLTTGVISGLGREIESQSKRPIRNVIQTDAAINPGNSGGPLLDSAGRLIGVNTAIYSPSGAYAGVGFAVPVDTVRRIVPQLIRHGHVKRPGLGVHILTDRQATQFGVNSGVVIHNVPRQSSAARAGFKGTQRIPGRGYALGDVIVKLAGNPISDTNQLNAVMDELKVGDRIDVTVNRGGKLVTREVILQAIR